MIAPLNNQPLSEQLRLTFAGRLPALVMFDLDGTLVDSVPDLAAAIDATLFELGRLPVGVGAVRLWVGNGAQVLVQRALASAVDVLPLDSLNGAERELQERAHQLFLKHYRVLSGQFACHYSGVRERLAYLREQGVAVAVVTNKPIEFVPHLLEDLHIAEFVHMSLGGDSCLEKKPHPGPLLRVLSEMSVAPQQALMVGDSRNDIEAARAAGVISLAVTYGYNHGRPVREEAPDLMCDSLLELIEG